MKSLIFLIACVCSCSRAPIQEFPVPQNGTQLPVTEPAASQPDLNPKIWLLRESNPNMRIATVGSIGISPNGDVETILEIQCPTEKNSVTNISLIVQKAHSITNFDFESFEGPDAPNLRKNLVEIETWPETPNLRWLAQVTGGYGGNDEPDSFMFSLSSLNKPDRAVEFARIIADGKSGLRVIVHDGKDDKKTIEAAFPSIDPTGSVAKWLNGCRP